MENSYFLKAPMEGNSGGETLDFDKSPSVQLVFAANRLTRANARLYQKNFNLGAMDWRLLVMLTSEPDIPVARIAKVIGIDKAAVSRSLSRLDEKRLAISKQPKGDARRKTWCLTKKGQALHNEMLKIALARQSQILNGFSRQEVEQLNALLKRLLENIATLE